MLSDNKPVAGVSATSNRAGTLFYLTSNAAEANATATDGCSPPGAHSNAWRYLAGGA